MKDAPLAPGLFRTLLSFVIALSAAWFAVGTQPWSQTLLIAALGVLYLLFPPSGFFPRSLLILSCLLLALGAMAFLPAAWFDASFRKPFQDQGIDLPWTYSPQPWWTWEDLTFLMAGLLWTWNCFEIKLSFEQRQFLISRYVLALGLVALTTIFHRLMMDQSLPTLLQGIGQFPNRNQTGDILVMGGICSLTLAISKITKERAAGILWMIMTIIFLIAIILNSSRAALALFGIGLLFVFALMHKDSRHHNVGRVLIVFVLTVGTLIFVSQGAELQSRFNSWLSSDKEGRVAIYQDAASMVKLNSWTGVGLGNFEGVFNTLRVHSANQLTRNLHPESDWWWIAAELGIGGVVTLGLLVIIGFHTYLRKTPFAPLTMASTSVAALFLIHSLFDVGGHRMGTVWPCLYIVSLGAFRQVAPMDGRLPKIFLRLIGAFLLALAFFRAQSISLTPGMPTRGSLDKVEEALSQNLSLAEKKSILDRSISWAPLNWLLYYQRGLIGLHSPDLTGQSDADFNRALYLAQNSIELPVAIGNECVHYDFPEAMRAWRQLLRKAGDRREEFFENLNDQNLNEKERYEITTLAGDDPQLQAIAVIHQNAPDFEWYLQNLFDTNPTLQGVSKPCLRRLLDRWIQEGDVDKFINEWPLHPEWWSLGWRAYARALAKTGHERDAVTTALHFISEPSIPNFPAQPDLDNAAKQFRANPQDSYRGILLYFAQKSTGLNDQALNTLLAVAKLPQPPSYISYLLVKDLHQANQDQAAWQTLEPLLQNQ